MNTKYTKTVVTVTEHEFNIFLYPFVDPDVYYKVRDEKAICFHCDKEMKTKEESCLGFGVGMINQIFHIECAREISKEFGTEIKERKIKV